MVARLLEETARDWQQQQQQLAGGGAGARPPSPAGSRPRSAGMQHGGSARLRDAIVWGFMMRTHREVGLRGGGWVGARVGGCGGVKQVAVRCR